ncbi:MAG: NADH-quinone oxidoreductase subunit A [Proteobacteria bacterium]|nr:NADH-quinone oxidoreductase subunit A [Pseudomonadota bacterium]
MLLQFGHVFVFLAVGAGFVAVNLLVSFLIRPSNPTKEKAEIYDCGEPAVGAGYRQFNMRFYLVAFVFVIFDVEIAFMYPVTTMYRDMVAAGWGGLAFVEIAIFVLILMVGFVYAWSQGGLDWVGTSKKE